MLKKSSKFSSILDHILFPLLLFIYPLRHIFQGIDLTDTGYSLGNYRFFENMDYMWKASTFLPSVLGWLMTQLPYGNTMIGMNLYTCLIISITGLTAYYFVRKHLVQIPGILAVAAILTALSLCWCPSVILYNYLTYLFFMLGAMTLYLGLVKDSKKHLVIAGFFLGMNVMVRLPNVAEAVMILALWYYGILQKKKVKNVILETLLCLGGYLTGFFVFLGIFVLNYGFFAYADGIKRLFAMTSVAKDYTLYEMVYSILMAYRSGGVWFLGFVLLLLMGTIVFAGIDVFLDKIRKTNRKMLPMVAKILPTVTKLLPMVAIGGFFLGVLVLIRLYYAKGMFNMKYYTYESMFQWGVLLLILAICVCFFVIAGKKFQKQEKLLSVILLLLMGTTPLGSNNHLYPNLNNSFLVAPYVFYYLWKLICYLFYNKNKLTKWEKSARYPVTITLSMVMLAIMIQSFGFGYSFVFRDGLGGEKRDTKIENGVILNGMYTNRENANQINELLTYVEAADYGDKSVLLFGNIPAISYMLDMPCAISSTWPDLKSYSLDTMKAGMEQIEQNMDNSMDDSMGNSVEKERPLVILGVDAADKIWQDISDENAVQSMTPDQMQAQQTMEAKLELIREFLIKYDYEMTFENDQLMIYE